MAEQNRVELGKRGEAAAARYLTGLGYRLLETNHRRRGGEVDLILLDGTTLVFCEVKTKMSELSGHAAEGYRSKQQQRMRALILRYLQRRPWEGPLRVDVIALQKEGEGEMYRVHHYVDALSFEDSW